MRLGLATGLVLALAGCAELRTPRPAPAPPDLLAGPGIASTVQPTRAALQAAADAFANTGLGLAGKPSEAAQAAAQLDYVAEDLRRNPQFSGLPEGVRRDMQLARTEVREALGIDAAAPSAAVVRALLDVARELRAGRRAAAAQRMAAPMFRPGGELSIRRLAEPGPLPTAAIATALALDTMTRIARDNRLGAPPTNEVSIDAGVLAPGSGGAIGSGLELP